ncbi:MAG: site-specific DNA-methyltransferase [Candidatus Thorarchaeota archaeon]|nr:site-specific DNA-methyltransferase [Candidatus Thorarchaeota archaeon]
MTRNGDLASKRLDIGHTRTCDCPENHISCLTAKEWLRYQVAVWEFYYEKKDLRDKRIHPAVFPIGLPKRCIELFTHKGELVLDPFVGSGTTLLAARTLERNAVGFDLKKEYVETAQKRLREERSGGATQLAICDDALRVCDYLDDESVSLIVTSPPYASLLNRRRTNRSIRGDLRRSEHYMEVQQYSEDSRDLGTMTIEDYSNAIESIFAGILPVIRPKGNVIINITDYWWEGRRVPAHIYVVQSMQKAGYELRNTMIWDRRNLVNRTGIYGWPNNYITLSTTFEYLLHFWKPSERSES